MKKVILIFFIIVLLFTWEIAASQFITVKFFISCPTAITEYFVDNYMNILTSTFITSIETISGFVLAALFSFTVMLFCLFFPKVLKIVLPFFIASQVLPIITLAPLFIILFGMGLMSKIAMVVMMCFFPIFINFSAGVMSISENTNQLLYIYNTKKLFKIFKVIIPLSTPNIFVGLKVSTTMAVMGAIVAEFMGARDGLGKNLYLAPKNSLPELMIISIILTTILGWFLFRSIVLLENKIGNWYQNNKN